MPPGLAEVCGTMDSLFHTKEWMSALERGLGCRSLYVFDAKHRRGAGISVFRAGPFQIGYLGFPVGEFAGCDEATLDLLQGLKVALSDHGLTALRIPVSAFGHPVALDLPFEPTPETAIVDLQSWSLRSIAKNRRRDVNKSLRSGLDCVEATDPGDGQTLYKLYASTLERKRGSLRYTAAYFGELIALSQRTANLRVLLAKKGDSIAAFTVVVRHGTTAYYLHGAFDWDMRDHIPSAMLLNESIEWAKAGGCRVFNLMSSPPGQTTLVRYKEYWGAETREHRTYTLPIRSSYAFFRIAERLYRMLG